MCCVCARQESERARSRSEEERRLPRHLVNPKMYRSCVLATAVVVVFVHAHCVQAHTAQVRGLFAVNPLESFASPPSSQSCPVNGLVKLVQPDACASHASKKFGQHHDALAMFGARAKCVNALHRPSKTNSSQALTQVRPGWACSQAEDFPVVLVKPNSLIVCALQVETASRDDSLRSLIATVVIFGECVRARVSTRTA